MRRVVVALGVGLGLLVPIVDGGEPVTATPAPPNIVFVLTDDQTMESLPIGLPSIDEEPGGHWVRFENAFLNTPRCCPSRATILTGRYSHHHGVLANNLGNRLDESSTVATWLDDASYRTGLFGKYLNLYPFPRRGDVVPPGWDTWFAFHGAITYTDFETVNEEGGVVGHLSRYSTDLLTDKAVQFLDDSSSDPFFLYLSYNAPHGPREPAPRHTKALKGLQIDDPPNFNEADVSDKPRWVRRQPKLTPAEERAFRKERRRQYQTLLSVDEGFQRVYDALDQNGDLDDTVIVFMTDNGYMFGEHRATKKTGAYEESARTPLLVRYPDGPAGSRTVDEFVSNVDIAPTFAELAGAAPASPVDGFSLVPILEGDDPFWRDAVLIESRTKIGDVPRYWAVRTATHKWIEYDSGERELYDLVADPYELENLQGTNPALEAALHARLVELRGF